MKRRENMDKENNVMVKLKRLKIEEEVITKSLLQMPQTNGDDDGIDDDPNLDLTKYNIILKSKHDLEDINSLFKDIKSRITSEETEDLDVGDLKREIIHLETKLKTFKLSAKSRLAQLIQIENELLKHNDEKSIDSYTKSAKHQQTDDKTLVKTIVPSPVQLLIDSPFKYPEVQQLQEFLKNSRNINGGWSPYYHNIFAIIWDKYFNSYSLSQECHYIISEDELVESSSFKYFKHHIRRKIPDLTEEEIISHSAWYLKYLCLKSRQQHAITLWKRNKELINTARSDYRAQKILRNANVPDTRKKIAQSKSFKSRVENKCGYIKPTVQWNSKCFDNEYRTKHTQYLHLDQIKKLSVPFWRRSI